MNDLYELCLWVVALAAAAIVPLLVVHYRLLVIPKRIEDLKTNLWNAKAIYDYVELFTATDAEFGQEKKMLDKIVDQTFFGIHGWRRYLEPLVPLTVVIAAVVAMCVFWADTKVRGQSNPFQAIDSDVILALSGAYVWSVYGVLSRARSLDLTPDYLMEVVLRLVAAVPIGHAFSLLALERVDGAFAFASAAFPLREMRLLLRERALRKLKEQEAERSGQVYKGDLNQVVDGIGEEKIARLEELHVMTYMDLAYVDPVWLMARTGHSLRLVLAWMDQALLAVYALEHKKKLVGLGVTCALDACEFYEAHCFNPQEKKSRDWSQDAAVTELAKGLGLAPMLLVEMLDKVYGDPHVVFLSKIWYSWEVNREQPNVQRNTLG